MWWEVTQEIFEVLEEFVSKMYSFNCAAVNKVRSKMFTKRLKQEKRSPDLSLLPPCKSVLKYHMQWAVYVAKLWGSLYIPSIDAPQFTEFGWDSEGKPIWVDKIFPEDMKDLLMLDSDAKSCGKDESNQYQEMDESEDDFEEESDYETEDVEEKAYLKVLQCNFKQKQCQRSILLFWFYCLFWAISSSAVFCCLFSILKSFY